ncbi:uncharacterized protein LOC110814746 isoform X2 [Carica papaya]|uniref:uncharacterized protein LOC110814746 isoform X2 n=1 Tax=Carica papaya TaxID=3649 RepID=UPI000B8CB1A1|nr:uncharacterized protein LOC110814746 isoform X2 [Carica papaya]
MQEESLQIRRFEDLPSASDFESLVESKNVPAVFSGCVKDWEACSKWNPSNGGLDYLEARVGTSIVEVMLSRSAPVFYGDLRSHERVPLQFSAFIQFCKRHMEEEDDGGGVKFELEGHQVTASNMDKTCLLPGEAAPQQIYLAQVPMMNSENEEKLQLELLNEDIQTPKFLEAKKLSSINLWMNSAQARSSTHYDPHHNLLCIVTGCKQVVLWPPSASPMLYPMPLHGEASNHSSVALENPDFSIYPRAAHSMECSQKIILHAGDALFIPEGWFHQVDSDDMTIAVNFWWQSYITTSLSDHMDAYYLRRILRRLTDKEMNLVLPKAGSAVVKSLKGHKHELPQNGEAGHMTIEHDLNQASGRKQLKKKEPQQRILLHELEPGALQALHELVSLVHECVNVVDPSQPVQCSSAKSSSLGRNSDNNRISRTKMFQLEDDPVAQILWKIDPCTLQKILLTLAHNFPRTLEALILHMLSPVGAEVLTQKFDGIDQQTSEEDRNNFYQAFYGAFDDQFAAMDAILTGKESFAHQAFKNVLEKYLGVNSDMLKPSAV